MRFYLLTRRMVFFVFISALSFGVLSVIMLKITSFAESYNRSADDSRKYADHAKSMVSRATFKKHFTSSNIIALRLNNDLDINHPHTLEFACASELFITSCDNTGMAAMLLMTLDHINLCRKIGAKPTVFWRNCNTVCPKDATINAWEMFFQPVNPNIEKKAKNVLCLGNLIVEEEVWVAKLNIDKNNKSLIKNRPIENLLNLSFRERNVEGFLGSGVITPEIRKKANGLLQEYVKVTPSIQKMVDQFYFKHLSNYNVLAVHIRGTDHYMETEEGKLPSLRIWIQNAKHLLQSLPSLNKIFIASDNEESVRRFVQEFGNKVTHIKAFRAKKYNGRAVHDSGADPYMLGSQVLVDILLMAKCKHFLHAESSVAALVSYFNPDIESHFLEYKQEHNKDVTTGARYDSSKHDSLDASFLPSNEETEEYEYIEEAFRCFQKNSYYSVCPNMHRAIFDKFENIITYD